MQNKQELKGALCVLAAAIIWGYAVVAQKNGTAYLGPFSFTGFRALLGAVTMLPLVYYFGRKKTAQQRVEETKQRKLLVSGSIAGGLMVATFNTVQQFGLAYTDAGKSAFITALYILFVPIFGIFLRKKVSLKIWLCVLIAMTGFYIMCMSDGISQINKGDLFVFIGTVVIAVHMYLIDYMVERVDALQFNFLQFVTCGIFCSIIALVFEQPTLQDIVSCGFPLLYAGICSSGFGYLCQVTGQKYLDPTKTSLILSSESVFALICGTIFLNEILTGKEYLGCLLIFIAILLSQFEPKVKSN